MVLLLLQYWVAPTHLKAVWDTLKSETALGRLFPTVHLEFAVTSKSGKHLADLDGAGKSARSWEQISSLFWHVFPLLVYVLVAVAAIIYWATSAIVFKAMPPYSAMSLIMVGWTLMIIT